MSRHSTSPQMASCPRSLQRQPLADVAAWRASRSACWQTPWCVTEGASPCPVLRRVPPRCAGGVGFVHPTARPFLAVPGSPFQRSIRCGTWRGGGGDPVSPVLTSRKSTVAKRLTAAFVRSARPGRYYDEHGLMLRGAAHPGPGTGSGGERYVAGVWTWASARIPYTSLADPRQRAFEHRKSWHGPGATRRVGRHWRRVRGGRPDSPLPGRASTPRRGVWCLPVGIPCWV